ncbi:AEC family transporter [Streptomyces sp. ID03-2B]|uniref:AEC family transporter n=1 Tax=Streptomyces caviscabies TaxID=90079 RepID=A0ABW2MGM4_9ACTN|nr:MULTISPECIES: AEC family transporter [unclassified Streptomyces]MCL6290595.1 AEC family transporter [Streptomyces sp. 43Y-GA-1]MDX3343171.1 AEC family transporter [Streptomyces sp. ME02-6979.5a]MDX3504789.1 AEC family transporter [Streptomyces sp. ATCC51928]MDX3593658.1 AEC family transporter [Streptomyces sp. ID03-2B]MDX5524463.1 AEC family transporter [Streptomyces sp. DE06-01C]
MQGVLTGFTVIATVIAVGYVLGRRGYLGQDGRAVLTRLAFNVATPALLFTMLADADLSVVLSTRLLVTATAVAATAGVFVVVAGLFLRWEAGRVTIGALCSSYVNAGNLGIPIAVYVLGDASLVAPVLLLQQILVTPLALTVLDLGRPGEPMSLVRRLTTPLRNPMAIASLAGVTVAASGRTLPGPLLEPLALIGDMSVPAVLIAFGISLHGGERPGRGEDRGALYLSAGLKTVAQPVVAWAVGAGLFGLRGEALLDVVVIAALPAAQNLFTYASHYRVAERFARESILLSTLLSVPVLIAVAALLGR